MVATSNFQQPSSPLDKYLPPTLGDAETSHPVVMAVNSGKRYVVYPYVASLLVMTFRRSLGSVRVVGTGEWPMGPLFGATMITSLFGWWGFPWGLVWSPATLFSLWGGGRDVTKEILTDVVGAAEAKQILAIAPKPKLPAGIWLARAVILVPVLIIGFFVYTIANS